jgi:four helix bundle protein
MNLDLKIRTVDFSLRILRLGAQLPRDRMHSVIARQLVAAGTSPGAHFREAIRARSKAEYVSKMNGGLQELEETLYWLEIVEGAKLFTPKKLAPLKDETNQLIAIFVSLIRKWRSK